MRYRVLFLYLTGPQSSHGPKVREHIVMYEV